MSFASNTIISSTILTKESLRMLENQLGMAKMVYRDWENKLTKDGETLGIRKPNVFRATKARARTNSALAESNITLTVATQAHVSFEWSTKEMTDTIDRISERYIKPALSALANTFMPFIKIFIIRLVLPVLHLPVMMFTQMREPDSTKRPFRVT